MSDNPASRGSEWRRSLIILVLLLGGAVLAWTFLGPAGGPGPDAELAASDASQGTGEEPAAAESEAAQEAVAALERTADDATPPTPAETDEAAAPTQDEVAGVAAPEAVGDPDAAPPADAPRVTEEQDAPDAPADPAAQPPTFDVVRVDPAGNAVIAGRATPGSTVRIELDGEEVEVAIPDAAGNFVALFSVGELTEPSTVVLVEADENGEATTSEQVVVLAPPANPAPSEAAEPADVASAETTTTPETGAGAAPEATSDTSGAAPEIAEAEPENTPESGSEAPVASAAPEAEAAPSSPTVIVADSTGVRVVQGGDEAPELTDNVVIDAITYDEGGDVVLSGRAPGEGFVRIYVDNEPIEVGTVGADGQWTAQLPKVDTGTYTLRVDQVDAEGAVLSRIETPFRREPAAAIRELAFDREQRGDAPLVELITVQPGNTLWGISNEAYGDGFSFVKLFEANKDKIRDPNLIYPGQVFSVPN